jgi:hypothetical protein
VKLARKFKQLQHTFFGILVAIFEEATRTRACLGSRAAVVIFGEPCSKPLAPLIGKSCLTWEPASGQDSMMKTDKDPLEVYYQCGTCQFVLETKKNGPVALLLPQLRYPPHERHVMVPVEEMRAGRVRVPWMKLLTDQGGCSNG